MRKVLLSGAVASALVLAPSPALAHEDLGTYDAQGAHQTHASPLSLLLAPLSDSVFAENVEHVKNVPGNTGGHIVAEGKRLYMGNYGTGFSIYDNRDPANPIKIGQWAPGPKDASDYGARADAVPDVWAVDGRHIVAFGGTRRTAATTRTEFVDATNPKDLKLLWTFVGADDGESHNSDVLDARGLWIPSGGAGANGLRIYDLSPLLASPAAAPRNLVPKDPENPKTLVDLWEESPYRNGRPVGKPFTHTHDVEAYADYKVLLPESEWTDSDGDGSPDPTYARRDILLMAEGGNYLNGNDTGSIFVVDITNPRDPVVLNRWNNTLNDGGLKPLRYYHEVQFVHGLDNVIVVTDEDLHNGCEAGGMAVLQAQPDLTQPIKAVSQWFNGTGTPAAMCSMHVFSTRHGYVYDGSYNAGLQIIDVRDPENPTEAGEYIAPGANSWGALVHAGYVYTGDFGARGLDVFKFTPPDGDKGNKGRKGKGKGKDKDKRPR